ncbi:MAG: type II toxin-antitoxin system prevent-host-death family antitoxin [Deltaproteobacteria bacterium]|nr:type II toxin-antitoxin system prevent-host-death family antitoxin [Deltaproteobacteria bacterium]
MEIVGVKELKDHLSHYINLTKKGDNLIVTDRGTPVAILHSLDNIEKEAGVEERLAALARQGKIRLPSMKVDFSNEIERPKNKGKLMSEIVIEDRR